jgi:hypothetical protein
LFGYYMEMMNTYLSIFYAIIALALIGGSFLVKSQDTKGLLYIFVIVGFFVGGIIINSWFLSGSAIFAATVGYFRLRQQIAKNRSIEVILISDHDDDYLNHFLNYYRNDITKYFPRFDFKIEEEYLVALLCSKMETVGLIVAEIKDAETLRICIDYMVPKYRNSQLARTFYQCELRCIDFLGYRHLFIEPQSREHNNYLERVGFRLVDGKYQYIL